MIAAPALVVLCWAATPAGSDGPQLPPRLIPDQTSPLYLRVQTDFEKSYVLALLPQPSVTRDQREWWFVQESSPPVPPDRKWRVRWLVDRVQAFRKEMKSESRFDSLRPDAQRPETAALSRWQGLTLSFGWSEDGRVVDLTGLDGSHPAVAAPNRHRVRGFDAPSREEISDLFAEIAIASAAPRGAAVGQSWTRPRRVERKPYGMLDGAIAYSVVEVAERAGRPTAQVSFDGVLTLTPAEATANKDETREHKVRSARYSGTLYADAATGRPLTVDTREELRFDLEMTSKPKPPAPRPARPRAASQPATLQASGSIPEPPATSAPATTAPASPPLTISFKIDEIRTLHVDFLDAPLPKPIVVQSTQPAATAAGGPTTGPVTPGGAVAKPRVPRRYGPRPAGATTKPSRPPPRPATTQPVSSATPFPSGSSV